MISVRQWVSLLLRHPIGLGGTVPAALMEVAHQLSHPKSSPGMPAGANEDIEISWGELRGNWVLEAIGQANLADSLSRFKAAQAEAARLPRDAYGASQRIANGLYLVRAHAVVARADAASYLQPGMIEDAIYLKKNPEYRSAASRFNNHFLNNYRAAVMLEAHRSFFPDVPEMNDFADWVGEKIMRHAFTLFSKDGVLLEGSVSYELLGLKHFVDIACCSFSGALADQIRNWLPAQAMRVRETYRKSDCWLLPQIGDCSPDWNMEMIQIFLDGFILGHETPYRVIWHEKLSALGF